VDIAAHPDFDDHEMIIHCTAEDAGIETADVRLMSTITQHMRNLPLEDTGDGALCTAWGVDASLPAA
jgi:hypothetical protein